MTQVLKLMSGTATTMNLLTGDLRVRADGWTTQSYIGEGEPVWDTFNLVGRATSEGAIGSAVYGVQQFAIQARRNANNVSWDNRLWLHWKPEGGSEARTLITDANIAIQSDPGQGGLGPLLNSDGFMYGVLATQHMPWWEGTSKGTYSSGTADIVRGYGDKWVPTVTSGDLPGRIEYLCVDGMVDTGGYDDFWIGIRPNYGGTTNFVTIWECEYGDMGTAGYGSAVAESFTSNGTVMRTNFGGTAAGAGAAMLQRVRISVSQATQEDDADDDMNGKYLVLGRLKCGSSTSCLIDLYQGLGQIGSTPMGIELVGETKVDNTVYKLIELGQVQIPPPGSKVFQDISWGYPDTTLYIYAQRLSGTSTLTIDCLILIPCEHMLTVKGVGMNDPLDQLHYHCAPDGKSIVFIHDHNSDNSEIVEHTVNDFTWPDDGGLLVFAAQASTVGHDMSGGAKVGMFVYPRYSLIKV